MHHFFRSRGKFWKISSRHLLTTLSYWSNFKHIILLILNLRCHLKHFPLHFRNLATLGSLDFFKLFNLNVSLSLTKSCHKRLLQPIRELSSLKGTFSLQDFLWGPQSLSRDKRDKHRNDLPWNGTGSNPKASLLIGSNQHHWRNRSSHPKSRIILF